MVLATGLYINACAKGEHMIPQTVSGGPIWLMLGADPVSFFSFMSTVGHVPRKVWLYAHFLEHGRRVSRQADCQEIHVDSLLRSPFTYCYPTLYMARNDPSTYHFSLVANIALYVTLLCAYYVFDCAMAQKSAFKMQQQGVYVPRKTFPQLPGAIVENPTYIQTKHGNKLLTSGFWAWARKPNYTADWIQSLTWGMCAGFNTPITFFYPAFFLAVLTHRCSRDFERCARKYGDDWKRYCEVVKYRFIPGVY